MNGQVPVVMMPLAQAREHGIVEAQEEEERKFRLSVSQDIKFDPLRYIKTVKEIGHDEDDWIDVTFSMRIVRIYLSPLKKYRGRLFDAVNFRRMLMKHRMAPVVVGTKILFQGWDYLEKVFGMATLVDFLWEFHEINYYFDGGYKQEPIEWTEEDKDSAKVRKLQDGMRGIAQAEEEEG